MNNNNNNIDNENISVAMLGSVDSGKCFDPYTEVLLYNGEKCMVKNLTKESIIMGHDYTKRTINEFHSGQSGMYEIICKKNDEKYCFISNGNHILVFMNKITGNIVNISVEDYLQLSEHEINNLSWFSKEYYILSDVVDHEIIIHYLGPGDYIGFSLNESPYFFLANGLVVHNSSLTGVLTFGELDDGNGKARGRVCKHPIETRTGRTHDITIKEINISEKNIELMDLCGHEKYLKTTLSGVLGHYPDYALLLIAGNKGMLEMTMEHLKILLQTKIPFSIVITKMDLIENKKNIYNNTMEKIIKVLKNHKRKNILITDDEICEKCSYDMSSNNKFSKIVPIHRISNKTGMGIEFLKSMLYNWRPTQIFEYPENPDGLIFDIDTCFNIRGIGIVMAGLLRGKSINIGDKLLFGPINGNYIPVTVKSMHDNFRNSINRLDHGKRGTLAIKIKKEHNFNKKKFKRGMKILNENSPNYLTKQFVAKVKFYRNKNITIMNNYISVVQCGNIRQTAKFIIDNNEMLESTKENIVKLEFLSKKEYLEPGSRLFFRDGKTRGEGIVLEILNE